MAPDIPLTEPEAPTKLRLAGMALRNGVLIVGPTYWGAAIRTADGSIQSATGRRPSIGGPLEDLPILRGPLRLTEMFMLLPAVRRALPAARLSFEAPSMLGSTLAGSVAARLLRRRLGGGGGAELVGSVAALGMVLGSMRGGEIAQYHGAEHKVIGGYEQDLDPAQATKEHERCGTHLAVPMLVANAAAVHGAGRLFPRSPASAPLFGLAAGLAASTELARVLQRSDGRGPLRTITWVGTALQSGASTEEPTSEQLEVAKQALAEVLAAEGSASDDY